MERKHRTAETSIQAFIDLNRSGQRKGETVEVFRALRAIQPCTRRMLNRETGIELTNLCRVLFDIVNTQDPLAKIAFVRKCPITNKKVSWYSLIDWQEPLLNQGALEFEKK